MPEKVCPECRGAKGQQSELEVSQIRAFGKGKGTWRRSRAAQEPHWLRTEQK